MAHQARIVAFTGDMSYSVQRCIAAIDAAVSGLSWLVVVETPKKTLPGILRSQWRHLRRNGLRWIPFQLSNLQDRWSERGSRGRRLRATIDSRPNLEVARVSHLHAQESLELVRGFAPDLGVALAAPILRRALFQIPRLGTLNLHKGRLPDYRGMPPAFWELWNEEDSVGCTVHWVDDKLDTGDVVCRTTVGRSRFSTVRGLQLQLDEVGAELVGRAVGEVLDGSANGQPQGGTGRTYRRPTLAQVAMLDTRLRRSQVPRAPALVRSVKDAGAMVAWSCSGLGLSRLLTPRVVVLLYHRVSDDARDLLTVGIEQFDRQMALLRKHCSPVSVGEILGYSQVPRSAAPMVAVTFDDGYLDNYVNAAPIMTRHGVPGAFFVSTGIVDKAGRFPHDVRLGNPQIPLMTWDNLRTMHEAGFVVGSHSVSHIDCAAESEEVVRAELAESRDRLRRELGTVDPLLFAYPYGGRQHMTAERLELVKAAGYAGCLSAFGGANVGTIDRYRIRRRGIHWEFSDRAFLFACLGWT